MILRSNTQKHHHQAPPGCYRLLCWPDKSPLCQGDTLDTHPTGNHLTGYYEHAPFTGGGSERLRHLAQATQLG